MLICIMTRWNEHPTNTLFIRRPYKSALRWFIQLNIWTYKSKVSEHLFAADRSYMHTNWRWCFAGRTRDVSNLLFLNFRNSNFANGENAPPIPAPSNFSRSHSVRPCTINYLWIKWKTRKKKLPTDSPCNIWFILALEKVLVVWILFTMR